MEMFNTKEIQEVREIADEEIAAAKGLTVKNPAELVTAQERISKLMATKRLVVARKEEITKPLNAALKSARALFTPIEDAIDATRAVLDVAILGYKREVDAKLAAERRKQEEADRKAEAERLKAEEAGRPAPVAPPPPPPKKVAVLERTAAAIQTRRHQVVKIKDPSAIPEAYWKLDEVAVRRDALAGVLIPGVEVVVEDIVVSR